MGRIHKGRVCHAPMEKDKNIKNTLYWYLWAGSCAFFLVYTAMQYMIFRNAHDKEFFKSASHTQHLLQTILENYKTTLEKISNEFKEQKLFDDNEEIVNYLKKSYVYGIENENKEKVRTAGISWLGVENVPLGRLGEIQYELTYTPEYLSKLVKNSGMLQISTVQGESSDFSLLNLGIGVRDKDGKYRGFVNARLNLISLRETLSQSQENDLQFILLNEKGDEIISSLSVENSIKENAHQHYVFPWQFPVNGFPYVLRFGYDKTQVYMIFLKNNYLYFILLSSFLFVFSFLVYFYHKKFMKKSLRYYKEKNREKNIMISQLTEENHQLVGRKKTLENYINSSEEATKEEKKFCLEINKRISHSLSKMLDISNFLLNRIQEESNIDQYYKELMEVFENIYIHSRFFTHTKEEELVSINDVLEESLVIHSKRILKKELLIKYPKAKVIAILTDRTALKQVTLNILGRAINNSPKKGVISLALFSQEETVCLECMDNGYLGEPSPKAQSTPEEKALSLDSMSLEREDIEKLVKLLGGNLSVSHKPYKGNTLLLQLPYQARNNKKSVKDSCDNVVSFAEVKKKR